MHEGTVYHFIQEIQDQCQKLSDSFKPSRIADIIKRSKGGKLEYIECPDVYNGDLKTLFIAGGITNCSNWQKYLVRLLRPLSIAVFNPRRKDFPIGDPSAAQAQIQWEHMHLAKADIISFWFCPETFNPITLYELGYWSAKDKPIVIGTHRDYMRKIDVIIQTELARPEVKVVHSIKALAGQIAELSAK